MRPTFQPRLVNSPFEDPGLFVPFLFEKRAFLFDLGDCRALPPRDLLKTTHVFITHTHMDHFIGFDRLLRLFLGRPKKLHLFGPRGFLDNMKGKLSGYSWDLVENYSDPLVLVATEVTENRLTTCRFDCRKAFEPGPAETRPFSGTLFQDSGLEMRAAIFEHSIPCLGFVLKERFHINIKKDALSAMGLEIGPWLKVFKKALFADTDPGTSITAYSGGKPVEMRVAELKSRIAAITPGQKIAYIADIGYSPINEAKAVQLAMHADHLFIEAPFLETEKTIASKKHHLTAAQAGRIAGRAKVKQWTLFHFSPRYTHLASVFETEALEAFQDAGVS